LYYFVYLVFCLFVGLMAECGDDTLAYLAGSTTFQSNNIGFVCSIFVRLSRKSYGYAIFRTNPHPLSSFRWTSFPVVSLTSSHLICYLFEAIQQIWLS